MESADSVWVGIEVTRQLRVVDGGLAPAGDLQAGGVNLLEHQIKIALQIAPPDRVCVLSPQGDERVLELIAQYEVRELAPFDFIAMLSERAKAGEEGAVTRREDAMRMTFLTSIVYLPLLLTAMVWARR